MYVFSFIHTYHSSTRPVLSFVLCYPKHVANLVPEVFLEQRDSREEAKTRREAARKRKTSGYLGLESHFHADTSCQTRPTNNYKRKNQWQLSNRASPRYYRSNEPIILICVFVKISINPSLRVRS